MNDSDEIVDIGIGDDILVVDDHPTNLIAIEAALAPLGRKLVFAGSGVEALARLLDQDFALILLDVAMPGITGIETARLIRSRERSRGTPILFITGMSWQDEAVDEAYEVGGYDFLIKPVRPEVLRAKARVFLKLQERTRALHRQAEELRASQIQLYEHELHEQRKRYESKLLDAKVSQLAEVERQQHELAGMIGNELLNPLQTLQMAFDLLREHPNADKDERIYGLVEYRLIHVTRLVKILIDIAQASAGQLELVPSTINVVDTVRQAVDDCRAVLDTRKLRVRLDGETGIAPIATGDPIRLLQAFTTLIDHAARSSPDGGDIAITARVAGGDVIIWIADYGRGIARELLPKIFHMFVTDAAGSVGLGLPLVKRLIELHDGAIRCSSRGLGQGATFEVRLPLAPQDVELPLDSSSSLDGDTFIPDGRESTLRMLALERAPTIPPTGASPEDPA